MWWCATKPIFVSNFWNTKCFSRFRKTHDETRNQTRHGPKPDKCTHQRAHCLYSKRHIPKTKSSGNNQRSIDRRDYEETKKGETQAPNRSECADQSAQESWIKSSISLSSYHCASHLQVPAASRTPDCGLNLSRWSGIKWKDRAS